MRKSRALLNLRSLFSTIGAGVPSLWLAERQAAQC